MTPLLQIVEDLCREFGILALYAYGSRAGETAALLRGEAKSTKSPGSDLDIGVLPPVGKELSLRDKVRLSARLEDLFRLPRVDLVVLPGCSAFLALEIVCGELLVDLDADKTSEYELYVMRRAGDLMFYQKRRRQQVISEGAR